MAESTEPLGFLYGEHVQHLFSVIKQGILDKPSGIDVRFVVVDEEAKTAKLCITTGAADAESSEPESSEGGE